MHSISSILHDNIDRTLLYNLQFILDEFYYIDWHLCYNVSLK